MEAKSLKCYEVNGKVFIIDSASGILKQCQVLPDTVMPTFKEFEAICNQYDKENN